MLGSLLPLFLDLLQTPLDSYQGVIDSNACIVKRLFALQIDRRLDPQGIIGQDGQLFCLGSRGCLLLLV